MCFRRPVGEDDKPLLEPEVCVIGDEKRFRKVKMHE